MYVCMYNIMIRFTYTACFVLSPWFSFFFIFLLSLSRAHILTTGASLVIPGGQAQQRLVSCLTLMTWKHFLATDLVILLRAPPFSWFWWMLNFIPPFLIFNQKLFAESFAYLAKLGDWLFFIVLAWRQFAEPHQMHASCGTISKLSPDWVLSWWIPGFDFKIFHHIPHIFFCAWKSLLHIIYFPLHNQVAGPPK